MLYSFVFGKVKAPRNPYNSLSLEWQTQSPPIHHNFEEVPVVDDWFYGYGETVKESV